MERTPQQSRALADFLVQLQALKPYLAEKYGVSTLCVFGSYVRGEQRADSDLDVLVRFSRTPTLFQLVRLENELGDVLNMKVDVVPEEGLKPRIRERVLGEVLRC